MARLVSGPDPRLAVAVACGLDPTLIPANHCEVGRDTITYRTMTRDEQGVIITDRFGCPLVSGPITVHRSDPIANRWYQY